MMDPTPEQRPVQPTPEQRPVEATAKQRFFLLLANFRKRHTLATTKNWQNQPQDRRTVCHFLVALGNAEDKLQSHQIIQRLFQVVGSLFLLFCL